MRENGKMPFWRFNLPTGVPDGEDWGSPGIEGVLVSAQPSQKDSPLIQTVSVLWTKKRPFKQKRQLWQNDACFFMYKFVLKD